MIASTPSREPHHLDGIVDGPDVQCEPEILRPRRRPPGRMPPRARRDADGAPGAHGRGRSRARREAADRRPRGNRWQCGDREHGPDPPWADGRTRPAPTRRDPGAAPARPPSPHPGRADRSRRRAASSSPPRSRASRRRDRGPRPGSGSPARPPGSRPASGRPAARTPRRSASWWTTRAPSALRWTSSSTPSAPCSRRRGERSQRVLDRVPRCSPVTEHEGSGVARDHRRRLRIGFRRQETAGQTPCNAF